MKFLEVNVASQAGKRTSSEFNIWGWSRFVRKYYCIWTYVET